MPPQKLGSVLYRWGQVRSGQVRSGQISDDDDDDNDDDHVARHLI